jgi:predicted nucleotide-binding protein
LTKLNDRRDIFLGYAGRSSPTASAIKTNLQSLGATVLDWQTDFIPGRTILNQIEQAAARSVGGIFLFTKDDHLAEPSPDAEAVPRDNVVFEAGYFIGLKGKNNVLIIREAGSKLPADLGGDIYAALPGEGGIQSIERVLKAFLAAI